jgi:hypothetical protein
MMSGERPPRTKGLRDDEEEWGEAAAHKRTGGMMTMSRQRLPRMKGPGRQRRRAGRGCYTQKDPGDNNKQQERPPCTKGPGDKWGAAAHERTQGMMRRSRERPPRREKTSSSE